MPKETPERPFYFGELVKFQAGGDLCTEWQRSCFSLVEIGFLIVNGHDKQNCLIALTNLSLETV
jgi:hypothetical protein